MKSRMARLGVLVAAVLGLIMAHMPAAEALTVKVTNFVVTATVKGTTGPNTAIAYPCFTDLPNPAPVPSTNLVGNPMDPLCLPLLLNPVSTKPKKECKLPSPPCTQVNIDTNHNFSTVAFLNNACVWAGVTAGKTGAGGVLPPMKNPIEAGMCVLGGGGFVAGHCGLATGAVAGTASPAPFPLNGTLPLPQSYRYNLKFTSLASFLILNGRVTKDTGTHTTGWLLGVAYAVADPTSNPSGSGPGFSSSCTNLHDLNFIVAGTTVFLIA